MDFDFETEVDDLDAVPEDFRPFYVRDSDDGPFALSDAPEVSSAVRVIRGLKGSLATSRREAKQYRGKAVDLSPLADFGDSPAAIAESFQKRLEEVSSAKGSDVKGQIEKIRNDMQAAHTRETQARDEKIAGLEKALYQKTVAADARAALAEANAISADLVMPFLLSKAKVELGEDGDYSAVVVDEKGSVRYDGATGEPMGLRGLVAEMKRDDQFKAFFRSEAPTGGGTRPGEPSRPVRRGNEPKSPTEKINAGLEKLRRQG